MLSIFYILPLVICILLGSIIISLDINNRDKLKDCVTLYFLAIIPILNFYLTYCVLKSYFKIMKE